MSVADRPVGVRQERSARRREQILRASVEVLSEQGIGALTHRSVAARAGLPPSSTGYYFPTIRELVEATFEALTTRGIEELRATASDGYRRDMTDDEVLDTITRALVESPRTPQLAVIDLYLEASRRPELQPFAEQVTEHFEWVVTRILDTIGVAEPGDTARAVWSYAIGSLMLRLGHPRPETDAYDLRAGLATVMAEALRTRT